MASIQMNQFRGAFFTALLAVSSACTIPAAPPSNTISSPFRVQIQNASYPEVDNLFMNLLLAGGGDQHLYVGPVGVPTSDLMLDQGFLTRGSLHAVLGGEFSAIDNTVKMFMTDRGDPRATFSPTYACNPVTDALQLELRFVGKQNDVPGGWICVRPTYDDAHEFRYYPPGDTKNDPNKFCIKVTLVAVPATSSSSSSILSTSSASSTSSHPVTSSTATTSSTTKTSTSSSATSSASSAPPPYTDMTSRGFAFVGCAPEERTVQPPDNASRTLPVLYATDSMTNELCMSYCRSNGYSYAGTEYRRECWCGNSYAATRQPGTTRASLAGCASTCMGNTTQICGGSSWLSLYRACAVGAPCTNAQFT
ncbi:hypothetical protein DL546_006595 [Coniochaeta pulveracea]|uniref:WSC domain-containing protein n=1 Tax=Coniochaeta pulveracea TaxID=177199 RepID=A0A420YMS3_9PEZI|nr:hypothetical protein DL546_006595 [Coniochaeta pulveracea]